MLFIEQYLEFEMPVLISPQRGLLARIESHMCTMSVLLSSVDSSNPYVYHACPAIFTRVFAAYEFYHIYTHCPHGLQLVSVTTQIKLI